MLELACLYYGHVDWSLGLMPYTTVWPPPAGSQSQLWLRAHPEPQGFVVGLTGAFGASCHIQALSGCTQQGFTAKPRVFAVPGPTGASNPGIVLPVISVFWPRLDWHWPTAVQGLAPRVKILALSFGSPRRARADPAPEASPACPPRTQSSSGAVPSPSRNIRNGLNVLPSSKCPTLPLP